MDADIEENAMLKAANFARTRRSEEVRRRSRYHADVQDNFSQTDIIEDCVPAQHIYSQLRWKQTALLCSLTFTLVLSTLSQIKQITHAGTSDKSHFPDVWILVLSLFCQCIIAFLLLIMTYKESKLNTSQQTDIIFMYKIIYITMVTVFIVLFLHVILFMCL